MFTIVSCVPLGVNYPTIVDALCDQDIGSDDLETDNTDLALKPQVGDNFVVKADLGNEGADFYVLQCVKALHLATTNMGLDGWNPSVESMMTSL